MGWKRRLQMVLTSALLAMPLTLAKAQATASIAIQQVLKDQVDAWNRGDVATFMQAYKDSPDTTFIGKSVEHGYAPILERYKKAYPNKDAMGVLAFSDFAVRELGTGYAVVTGRFHLGAECRWGRGRQRHLFIDLGEDAAGLEDYSGPHQRGLEPVKPAGPRPNTKKSAATRS